MPVQDEHPRVRIRRLADQVGEAAVVAGCVAMLRGEDAADPVVAALGGRNARWLTDGERTAYWGRVWGARGLLYVFDDAAIPALAAAVTDEHWRVREMVAKVVARHRVDALAGPVATLRADGVPRVRAAAERALVTLARPAQRKTNSSA
jgi:hypothetical protein